MKLSRRWYSGGKAVSGAPNSSYKLKAADKGRTLTVKVTGAGPGFTSATAKASVKVK